MFQFPAYLETLLLSYLKQTFLAGKVSPKNISSPFNDKDLKYFAKGAARLNRAYTSERGSLPANYLSDPVLRSGYLLYFLPVNFLKIVRILQELTLPELTAGQVRILDVGAGPGTSMLGVMAFYADLLEKGGLKDAWLDFTLVDQNYSLLKDARTFHDAYKGHLTKQFAGFRSALSVKNYDIRRGDFSRFLRNFKYHLIVVSNVLNEFSSRDEEVSLVRGLLQNHLEPKSGKLVIIEPALRKTSRDLQHVRDEVITKAKLGHVWAPCLHQEVCPLNVTGERDWCHFYLSWKLPPFVSNVSRIIGTKKEWLALSYLVLSKTKRHWHSLYEKPHATWRVISNLMPSKGKKEVVFCGPPGRYHLTRLDKSASPSNRVFDSLERGDIVEADVRGGKKYRVDGEARVEPGDHLRIIRKM